MKLGIGTAIVDSSFGDYVYIASGCSVSKSVLGNMSYCSMRTKVTNTRIGAFTCIGPDVKIGLASHPTTQFASLHPAFYSTAAQVGRTFVDKQKFLEKPQHTIIGSDVWIGANVIIPGGVVIGDGAVVASGAVVTKNVLPYEIVGGVPAKTIGRRFTEEQAEILLETKWWENDIEVIDEFSHRVENVERFVDWLNENNKVQAGE